MPAPASTLYYLTPKVHQGIALVGKTRRGIIAYKIAVHAADIARIRAGIHDSRGRAFLSCYRIDLGQFALSLEPETACLDRKSVV